MQSRSLRDDGSLARPAFTLVELMAAMALLVSILAIVFTVFDLSTKAIRQANAKIDSFQVARVAFDAMTTRLQQATLNTYFDYYDSGGNPYRQSSNPAAFVPFKYGRYSDLHFVSGQASSLLPVLPPDITETSTQAVFFTSPTNVVQEPDHIGMKELLSASGFFAGFGTDRPYRPSFIGRDKYRWRLFQLTPPAESLNVMKNFSGMDWFGEPVSNGMIHPVAENVIALVIWPRLPVAEDPAGDALTSDYSYDSRVRWKDMTKAQPVQSNQLPATLSVTMVVLDEVTAESWSHGSAAPAQVNEALDGLFQQVGEAEENVREVERRLSKSHAVFRTFTSSIAMRESKWSE